MNCVRIVRKICLITSAQVAMGWSIRRVIFSTALSFLGEFPLLTNLAPAVYDKYYSTYDSLDGGLTPELLGLNQMRKQLGREVKGNVLEIAVGTGLETGGCKQQLSQRYSL